MTKLPPCAPESFIWTTETIKGLLRKLFQQPKVIPGKDAKDYFSEISISQYRKHHSAAGDPIISHYLACSPTLKTYENSHNCCIYDLGTGYGDFYATIKVPSTSQVVLVDFIPRTLEITRKMLTQQVKSVQCLVADLRIWQAPKQVADLVVCVNVLPYLETAEPVFRVAASLLKQGAHLCLIYPVRHMAWEEQFGGIRIMFHDPIEIKIQAESAGLKYIEDYEIQFSAPGTFGRLKSTIARLSLLKLGK